MRAMRCVAITAAVGFTFAAQAVQIVVPNINASTPGPSNQAFPFNAGSGMRYQQVFTADQFGGATGVVRSFAYRVDETEGAFGPTTIQMQAWLSHTTAGPFSLSTTFDNNSGGDKTQVFNGAMTISSAGVAGGFDIVFDINDVFTYNGTGNLLLELKVFSGNNTVQFDAAGLGAGVGGTPWTHRVWSFGTESVSGSTAGDDGMVTQFTIGAVPEPATLAVLGLGVLALRRRRK